MIQEGLDTRLRNNQGYLERLLAAAYHQFDSKLHSSVPEKPGIYRICMKSTGETLRVGTTKSSNSLHQRIYRNHFMGNQAGNIRSQLVKARMCSDLKATKDFLRRACSAQWLEIERDEDRKWADHFILSMLQPRFSD